MYNKIALDWRLQGQRYRLEGVACLHCGAVHFPPRAVCLECGQPMNGEEARAVEQDVLGQEEIRVPVPFVRVKTRERVLVEA